MGEPDPTELDNLYFELVECIKTENWNRAIEIKEAMRKTGTHITVDKVPVKDFDALQNRKSKKVLYFDRVDEMWRCSDCGICPNMEEEGGGRPCDCEGGYWVTSGTDQFGLIYEWRSTDESN